LISKANRILPVKTSSKTSAADFKPLRNKYHDPIEKKTLSSTSQLKTRYLASFGLARPIERLVDATFLFKINIFIFFFSFKFCSSDRKVRSESSGYKLNLNCVIRLFVNSVFFGICVNEKT